jgi:signal transduction histidine kinase
MAASSHAEAVTPVDDTLRRVAVGFRLAALAWMAALVVATLITDDEADTWVVVASMALATAWTMVTVFAAQRDDLLRSSAFLLGDVVVALLVTLAPIVSDAGDLYFGGYPLSTMFIVAYARGTAMALMVATLLGLIGFAAGFTVGRDATVTQALGNVLVFLATALVIGWAYGTLRERDARRRAAEEALATERELRARHETRADMANQLHDSVLQTLALIQAQSEDQEIRYLARRQERELRGLIRSWESRFEDGWRARIQGIADDVEDLFRIRVETACIGDGPMDPAMDSIAQATREALTNAAKHSGAEVVSLFAELNATHLTVLVKDAGRGFDRARAAESHGLQRSIEDRVSACGGTVAVRSAPGHGTEVEITVTREQA